MSRIPVRLPATEAQIQKAIMQLLAAEHVPAIRYNTAAFKVGARFFRAHSAGPGHPDIVAYPNGQTVRCQICDGFPGITDVRPLWIEVKRSKGKLTQEQIAFANWVSDTGIGTYLVARSSDDVLTWLRTHGKS